MSMEWCPKKVKQSMTKCDDPHTTVAMQEDELGGACFGVP